MASTACLPTSAFSFKSSSFFSVRMNPPIRRSAPEAVSITSKSDQSPVLMAVIKPFRFSTTKEAPLIIKPIPASLKSFMKRKPMPLINKPRFFTIDRALSQLRPFFTISLILETIPATPAITKDAPPSFTLPNNRKDAPSASANPPISFVTLVKLAPFSIIS